MLIDHWLLYLMELIDDDKQYTLTHCRFEAKASHGLEDILIVDFDEFLFCPKAGATAASQMSWFHTLLRNYKHQGKDSSIAMIRIEIMAISLDRRRSSDIPSSIRC